MPVYAYKGLDTRGKAVSGVKDADNAAGRCAQTLRKDGMLITEAKEVLRGGAAGAPARGDGASGETAARSSSARSISCATARARVAPQDVAVLTRQLGTLLKAGIPLAESLGALVEQVDSTRLQARARRRQEQVNEGSSLGDALARHPKVFQDLYVNMVRAGEAAGNLDAVLFRLADFLDAQNALRGKVIAAR